MSHKPDSAPATDPRPIEQRAFENLGRAVGLGAYGGRGVNAVFKPLFSSLEVNRQDWGADAHHALALQKLPRARALLYAVAVIVLLLLVWAGLAPIDEVTRGEGKVIPSRQLQVVQSVDGGVVEALFVKEGQKVAQGDLLVRIDPTRFVANYEEGTARAFALRAKADRLTALVDQKPYKPELVTDLNPAQQRVLEQQQRFYQTSKAELAERIAIAREQLTQRQKELNEAEARLAQASRNHGMAAQELAVTKPLLASGAASEVEILRLERDVSQASGEVEQARARMAQIEAGVTEAQGRIRETGLAMRNQWRAELAETLGELNSLGKNVSGLADRVKYAEIRSPVHGTVQRLLFNTLGGVVQPGNAVVEIVPDDDQLLVEARIAPRDIAFLHPGLPAIIKFHAYDYSIYGGMSAQLQHISADTITDERGNTFYLVRAATGDTEFARRLSIIPGMTVQLDVLTGKKTVLSYLLKPILRAKANALSER